MTLLVHDGELDDLRTLLEEVGTPFVERRGGLGPEDREIRWELVIATPKLMLELNLRAATYEPQQLAILEQDSRTLRNSLRRAGITQIVRRPVHRAALRALIVHALYRGPEKRRATRVSIGAPVRFRAGWRQRPAILADLSVGGCRLLTGHPTERGASFALQIPGDVAGGKAFSVKARTLQAGPADGAPPGTQTVTARFENVSRRQHERLRAVVAAHSDGPAVYCGAGALPSSGVRGPAPERVSLEPATATACASASVGAAPECAIEAVEPAERREAARCEIEQRVVALGEEATRVLMGHEISVGGMRVQPCPGLEIGMELDLAVHVDERDRPLVVRARVHRDDGERGLVLRFHELDAEVCHYLNDLMDRLPVVDADDGEGYLVTEILATA